MKPTYEELEHRLTASEADNQKAMRSLKQADKAVKLALASFTAMSAEVSAVLAACEQVYAVGYNHGHLHTVDGIAYEDGTKEEFAGLALEVLASHMEIPATNSFMAELKAQGVEMLLASLPPHYTARADIESFAAQLRQGAKS